MTDSDEYWIQVIPYKEYHLYNSQTNVSYVQYVHGRRARLLYNRLPQLPQPPYATIRPALFLPIQCY